MNFTAKLHSGDILSGKYPVLGIGIYEDEDLTPVVSDLDKEWGGAISRAFKAGASPKEGDVLLVTGPSSKGIGSVALIGCGRLEKYTYDAVRRIAGASANYLRKRDFSRVAYLVETFTPDEGDLERTSHCIVEGARLGTYVFDQFKTEKDTNPLSAVDLHLPEDVSLRPLIAGLDKVLTLTTSTILARDWGNTPSNYATPSHFAKLAKDIAKETDLVCRVLEEKECRKIGMGAFLGVAQGSAEEPKFIILDYKPRRFARTICFVGKAITFDTGGISLKPAQDMDAMKIDCGGGLAVIGLMRAVGLIKPSGVRVIGIVPSCENMPSGTAIKPGDILTTQSGKSIEVLNTDAEGRLILADGLEYASREFRPSAIVDAATLTGACVVALGNDVAGYWSNNEELAAAMNKAQADTGEKAWRMPLVEEYNELLKSECADTRNIGTRWGGAITAALFLKKFIKDTPWLHLDLAGPAIPPDGKPWRPKGASGYGARLLYSLLEHWMDS
jgi:leucyl aminopeptidase